MGPIRFELKYCERCGGLWLRRSESAAVYCCACAQQMAEIARRLLRRPMGAARVAALAVAILAGWAEPVLVAAGRCA